jgi:mRNA interferase MazF
VAHLDPETA